MANNFIEMLKKNWIGGGIGVLFILVIFPGMMLADADGAGLFYFMKPFQFMLWHKWVSSIFAFIIGAYIQSKVKK